MINNMMSERYDHHSDQTNRPITYYDANLERYITVEGECIRSGNGWSANVEYVVVYKLSDGRFLGGIRHHDRGDLMTNIRYAKTAKAATPT